MSLNLKVNQQVFLQDTAVTVRPPPGAPTYPPNALGVCPPISTGFDEPFCVNVNSYTNYTTGDKEVLNAGQSISITPTFVTQFVMITSSLLFDISGTQPGYTRNVQGVSAAFPTNNFTVSTLQYTWLQFGIFSNLVLTSRQNGNKFKWFIMGNEPSELSYISITNQSVTSPSDPFMATGLSPLPVFNVPYKQYVYVVGVGGPVTITANPSISPGLYLNQQITVVGTDDTDTVTIDNGLGTSQNGFITLGQDDAIDYYWNGSYWSEEGRR